MGHVCEGDDFARDGSQLYIPKRFIFTLLGFLGMTSAFTLRCSFGVVIVAMVNNSKAIIQNYNLSLKECPMLLNNEDSLQDVRYKGEQYDWDANAQGHILAAIFYGFIFTQIPGTFFSAKYGAKWMFGGGVLTSAIFYLLVPLAATCGVWAVICVRIVQGLGEGLAYPAITTLLSRWSPKLELSRILTIVWLGIQIGNCASLIIAGWLCSTDFLGGWPSVFYIFGSCGCLWFLLWTFFIYETPMEHPSISKEELLLFEDNEISHEIPETPWKDIFLSLPTWALAVAFVGFNFGNIILLTELPSYLCRILHFDITSGGYLTALPYLSQAACGLLGSYVADKLRKSGNLSITTIRKIFNSIGLYGPSICFLGITISGCHYKVIIALFSIAVTLNGCVTSGFRASNVDMSPDFAGTIYGLTCTLSVICGSVGPSIVAIILASEETMDSWNCVFYMAAAIYAGTATFYAIFASAEIQPWGAANVKQEKSAEGDT